MKTELNRDKNKKERKCILQQKKIFVRITDGMAITLSVLTILLSWIGSCGM